MNNFTPEIRSLLERSGFTQETWERMDEWEKDRYRRWDEDCRRREEWRRRRELHHLRTQENPKLFLDTEDLFVYDPKGRITSQALYELYCDWCQEEELPQKPMRAFLLYVKEHASHYQLKHTVHVPDGNGKRVRGFYGIRPLTQQEKDMVRISPKINPEE